MRAPRSAAVAGVASLVLTGFTAFGAPAAQAATEVYTRPADGVLHLAGHGFGHGHGLSQWGAYGGAQLGQTWQKILAWYYASPKLVSVAPMLTVRISADGAGSDGRYDVRVKPASGLLARDSRNHKLALPTATSAAKPQTYDQWRAVVLSDGTERVQGHTSAGWASVAPTGATATSWTGWIRFEDTAQVLTLVRSDGMSVAYRGYLQLVRTSGAGAMTVNVVGMENYLYGVLPAEMPCSWTPTVGGTKRLDALAAQAVAARSYAAWRLAHPRNASAALVDNTGDQAYGGYTAEREAATQCPWPSGATPRSASRAAVTATAKQVMVDSAGHAIFAQFSASNGGFEISGGPSYLPSRPDAWDGKPSDSWSSHSWTDTVTATQIEQTYPAIGTFRSLSITGRERLSGPDQSGATVGEQWGGRVTALTLTGSKGSVDLSGSAFHSAMSLMSEWFTVVAAKPGLPRSVAASPGNAQATVSWAAPASDGGASVTSYTVTASPAIPAVTVAGGVRSAVIKGLTNDRAYVFTVVAHNAAGASAGASSPSVTPAAPTAFHPLTHVTLFDTGTAGLAGGAVRPVQVTGVAGVPRSGVTSVVINLVSVDSTSAGSLTVWPHGRTRPPSPQLSWSKGQRVSTSVWVDVGSNGQVDVANSAGTTRVRLLIEGYSTPASAGGDVLAATPTRRVLGGTAGLSIAAGATKSVTLTGANGVPTSAAAAVVQLTVVQPGARTYLRAWPSGGSAPGWELYAQGTSSHTTTAVIPLNAKGAISVSPSRTATVKVDLVGWFTHSSAATAPGMTALLNPARRLTTTSLAAGATATLTLPSSSGVSPLARSVYLLLTATGPATGSLRLWPAGTTSPDVDNVQLQGATPSVITVLVPLGSGAKVSVSNPSSTAVALTVDVVGWSSG